MNCALNLLDSASITGAQVTASDVNSYILADESHPGGCILFDDFALKNQRQGTRENASKEISSSPCLW